MNEDNKTTQENQQQNEPNVQLGRHDESAKADVPVFKPNGRPWILRTFVIIIMVLLLALAGLFGWLWWQERKDDKKENTSAQTAEESSEESEQTANECPENFSVYANDSLGVEFCYPTAWGEVEASDAKFAAADTGSRWRLSFADKSQANLGLVSEDWSTEVAREITCVDPAVQVMPEFSPFSTDWQTNDGGDGAVISATRGIEVEDNKYLIEERVDELLTNGACITGYTVIDNETYPFATSTYYYSADDVSVQMYIDNPEDYVSSTERADFATFVKSIKAYEE